MMEEIAAARAAVKLGSAVMAAVAALRVSAKVVWGCGCCGNSFDPISCADETCRPENFDWL